MNDALSRPTASPDGPAVFAPPDIAVREHADGLIVTPATALAPHDHHVGRWVSRGAAADGDAVMLADRSGEGGGWHRVTYGEALAAVQGLGQALLDRGVGPERPLVILSEKSVRHGLLLFAALYVGVPAVSVSASWSLRPEARDRLRQALALLTPGLVYAEDGADFAAGLELAGTEAPAAGIVCRTNPPAGMGAEDVDALAATAPTGAVDRAHEAVAPDTLARIMFTSGSTGPPKAVKITHGMLSANQQALRQVYPFLAAGPPVMVDWQPWHHCGGGAINLGAAIANGGAYYCDLGKPVGDGIRTTLDNLRGRRPTLHFNVPLGYDRLLDAFEQDPAAAADFFGDLRLLIYSAAGMPQSLWDRLAAAAGRAAGRRVPMVSSYGMTEMAPLHTTVHWPDSGPGEIGVPVPGAEVRLVPAPDNPDGGRAGRFELRARGPNITPGYFRQPDYTADAFDADGWYLSGDAVRFVDPADPNRGFFFDGRLVEQFKLQTGTWVMAGDVRTAVMSHLRPLAEDVLVVGENRQEVGLLVFPDVDACAAAAGVPADYDAVSGSDAVRAAMAAALGPYNEANGASSRRIARFLILPEGPSFAAGETTDKGYINQRLAIRRREAAVRRLYEEAPDAGGGIVRL